MERINSYSCRKYNAKKFLGEGAEAKVYAINDKYVLRLLHDANSDLEFLSIEDIFEGRNFGQAIAKDQNGNTINKRVFGSSLYDRYSTDPKIYLQNLREYVNLSDEALEAFVSDIAFINSKGYCIDHRNPENFLYDKKTGKIGIVDISEKTFVNSIFPEAFEPYSHIWVLSPLLNGYSVIDIYKEFSISERQEFFELVEKLESRILPLCEKYGIPLAKWEKDRYLVTNLINLLDLRKKIDPIKCDNLQVPIFYERYPELIKFLNDV